MPRKTFANGFPLPASDLNTYLMDQSVQTYADATARTAALATPVEGQMSYLADTNTAYVYDGSSWNAVVDAKNYGATLPNGAAGRNGLINGGMDIWQRGTSVASGGSAVYAADRWYFASAAAGRTLSRQSSGLTGINYAARLQRDSGNAVTTAYSFRQNMETVESLKYAGQTVTVSFYARAGANYSATSSGLIFQLKSGTGTDQNSAHSYTGETNVINQTATLTTTWQRFTYSGTVASTATELSSVFVMIPTGTAGAADYVEITAVQLETGSIATPFARNGGSIQAELAACQRYYYRITPGTLGGLLGFGTNQSTTAFRGGINFPVEMRIAPTALEQSGTANQYQVGQAGGGGATLSVVPTFSIASTRMGIISATVASGLTQFQAAFLQTDSVNGVNAYLGWSAEL